MRASPGATSTPRHVIACAFALAAIATLGCASDREPTTPRGEPVVLGPVRLLSPAAGGRFVQNDGTLGCTPHPTRGAGFRVAFDWRDVEGAERYRVVFWQRHAQFPAIERDVVASEYEEVSCNAFVADPNVDHWAWKVAAIATIAATDSSATPRDTVLWSEEREFGFMPCRLANGDPCNAPGEP